nr:4'-phosphopantetheinyl transferase superfamily protein [Ancylobacter oerskovii]
MRGILGQAIGREAEALSFARNAYGKPALKGHERLGFNLSHSEGLGVLAVADGIPLGVDVEKLAPVEQAVAEISFSRAERAELAACEEDQWLASFYRHWTRKEAIIKALGLGLAEAPDLDDITPEAGTERRLLRLKGTPETVPLWELFHFVPAAGYMGALAAPGSGHAIVLKRWSPPAR